MDSNIPTELENLQIFLQKHSVRENQQTNCKCMWKLSILVVYYANSRSIVLTLKAEAHQTFAKHGMIFWPKVRLGNSDLCTNIRLKG